MKVGIRFSDNDFVLPIMMFFELYIIPNFIEREEGHMITHLTTSQIVDMFNLYVVYCLKYQRENDDRDFARDMSFDFKNYKDYLQITEMDVYWDDKTDEYVEDWESGNGSEFTWTDGKKVY